MEFGGYRHDHLMPISFNWEPIGSANSGKRSTLGFGGYRHAYLIPISFNWEPIGSANSGKRSALGFGGYRHAHLIPILFNWMPIGSANSGKSVLLGAKSYFLSLCQSDKIMSQGAIFLCSFSAKMFLDLIIFRDQNLWPQFLQW